MKTQRRSPFTYVTLSFRQRVTLSTFLVTPGFVIGLVLQVKSPSSMSLMDDVRDYTTPATTYSVIVFDDIGVETILRTMGNDGMSLETT